MERRELVRGYLEALDLQDRELDRQFLNDVVARHVATFAFGSVGCRLGDELPLDFESLYERIVVRRRGGYCFEQNGLLFGVLEELGFAPDLYLARVINNQETHPGLTHRISMVEFDGQRYVLDVGFGSQGPSIPVLFSQTESKDGDRIFRIAERWPGEYHMQVLKEGDFFSLYRFELSRYGPSDCEVGHFYSHKHPDAAFVNHLVASLILEDETRSLRDRTYWVITKSGSQEQEVCDTGHLRRLLVDEFGLQVTEEESRRLYEGLEF